MAGALASWLSAPARVTIASVQQTEDAMQDEHSPKEKKDKKIEVPPTGAKTNTAVEPSDEYELDSPIPTDAGDGALEEDVEEVPVPPTGAKTNTAVEPSDEYDLDSPIPIDAGDGALEDRVEEVPVPPTGAKTDSAVEPANKYELELPVDEEE